MLRDAFYHLFVFIVSLYFQELDYIYNFHLPPVSKSLSLQPAPMPDRAQATTAPPHTATNHFLMMSAV